MTVIIEELVSSVPQGTIANTEIKGPLLDENGKAIISEDNKVLYEE